MTIDISTNIDDYFAGLVKSAFEKRNAEATPAAEQYLAGLLSDYAREAAPLKRTLESPLTFQLHEALQTAGAERFDRLRTIGDAVLYVLGFFREGLSRRGADPEYVMRVGASAYGHASAMLKMGGGAGEDVLDELARKFSTFVEVVAVTADGLLARRGDGQALVRLYERWQSSGSSDARSMLRELGFPVAAFDDPRTHN